MSVWNWVNNGDGVQIGHVNGSIEYKAGDIGRSLTLCQHCAHMKWRPVTVTIGEDIAINGESSYCAASGVTQMQLVDGAIVKCSRFREKKEVGSEIQS